jgi:hypothetical protein
MYQILHFTRGEKRHRLNRRFRHPPPDFHVDRRELSEDEQRHLARCLAGYQLESFDRVILDLKWSYLNEQSDALAGIENLVIYEHDAWYNFSRLCADRGKFSHFYRSLDGVHIIVPSRFVADNFLAQGINAHCAVKSFEEDLIFDEGATRDIELGFMGRTDSSLYRERRRFLHDVQRRHPLTILEVAGEADYRRTLSRIRIFVSADMGMNEYMAKNFEAMACGCALMAFRQGLEEAAIGLVDMENCALYSSRQEFDDKLAYFRRNPIRVTDLAKRGQEFAISRHTHRLRDQRMFEIIRSLPSPRDESSDGRRKLDELPGLRQLQRIRRRIDVMRRRAAGQSVNRRWRVLAERDSPIADSDPKA